MSGHKDALYTLAVRNESELFSAGADGLVVHWNLLEGNQGTIVAKVNRSIYALQRYDSNLVLGENFDGIHVLDTLSKRESQSLHVTDKAIFDIQLIEDNYWIATGGGEVIIVSQDMQIRKKVRLSDMSARCIAHIPSREEVAVGFSDNKIRILSSKSFEERWQFEAHENSVFSLTLSPDEKYLMSTSRDARFKAWSVESYELTKEVIAHMYAINSLDFSPSGQYFVTCSMDKSVKVWESGTFSLLKVIDKARHAGHATSVNKVKWMSEERIASCSDDRTVSIWSVKMKN